MRLKDLFTVPKGQKITERHLRRVLISSICSILLCMSCLVSTTWAWYIVDIENTENVINIGTPQIKVTVNDSEIAETETSVELSAGTNVIKFEHGNVPDSLDQRCDLYVTLMFNGTDSQCIVLNHQNNYGHTAEIEVPADMTVRISWLVTWFKPDGVDLVDEIIFTVTDTEDSEDTEGTEEDPTDEEDQEDSDSAENPDEGEGGASSGDGGNNNGNNETGGEGQGDSNTNTDTGDNGTGNDQIDDGNQDNNNGDNTSNGVTGGEGDQQTPDNSENNQEDGDKPQTDGDSETPVEDGESSDTTLTDTDSMEDNA